MNIRFLSIVATSMALLLVSNSVFPQSPPERLTQAEEDIIELKNLVTDLEAKLSQVRSGEPGEKGDKGDPGPKGEPGTRGPSGSDVDLSFPERMVVAFEGQCPSGWTEYSNARGRVILGVNDQHLFKETAGEEMHTLSTQELPNYQLTGQATDTKHSHPVSVQFSTIDGSNGSVNPRAGLDDGRYTSGSAKIDVLESGHGHAVSVLSGGNNEPHNNMPPYIALYFCTPTG